jgi:hypothetical protein
MWDEHLRMSAESECRIYHDPMTRASYEYSLYLTDEDGIMMQNKTVKV